MVFVFEVEDLEQASLATISRCGMLYTDQNQLGYNSIIVSFFIKF